MRSSVLGGSRVHESEVANLVLRLSSLRGKSPGNEVSRMRKDRNESDDECACRFSRLVPETAFQSFLPATQPRVSRRLLPVKGGAF